MSMNFLFLLFTIVVLHKCYSHSYCDYDINVCFLNNGGYSTNLIDARDICAGDGSTLLEIYNQAYQDAVIEAFTRWGYNRNSTFCMLNLKYVNGVYKWQSNDTVATYTKWNRIQSSYTESTFFISSMDPFNWFVDTDMSHQIFYPVVCMKEAPPVINLPSSSTTLTTSKLFKAITQVSVTNTETSTSTTNILSTPATTTQTLPNYKTTSKNVFVYVPTKTTTTALVGSSINVPTYFPTTNQANKLPEEPLIISVTTTSEKGRSTYLLYLAIEIGLGLTGSLLITAIVIQVFVLKKSLDAGAKLLKAVSFLLPGDYLDTKENHQEVKIKPEKAIDANDLESVFVSKDAMNGALDDAMNTKVVENDYVKIPQ